MGRADEGVDEGDGVEAGEGGDPDGRRQRAGVDGRKCRWGQDGDCYVAIVQGPDRQGDGLYPWAESKQVPKSKGGVTKGHFFFNLSLFQAILS